MNYAIKINALVNSLWPENPSQPDHIVSQENLNQVDLFLENLSFNEFHQIIELCTQKSLFVVLQKSGIVIEKHIHYKAQLLKEINSFFQNWVIPQYPYNLKRSYDVSCLEHYFESSIGKVLGKILKEISKSNAQSDWDLISSFISSLGQKSHFYQILIILGYFCEIENLEEEFEEYESVREILKNFEYEVIPKVMEIVIRNVSFCKETLEVVELETMSKQLSLVNDDFSSFNKNFNIQQNSFNENVNQSKIKFLKMNFEILRKVVEFNYQRDFKVNKQNQKDVVEVPLGVQKNNKNSFPEYMIRLFLETELIGSLYEAAQILIGSKIPVKDIGLGFGEIVLDLINKISRTKIEELNQELKKKLMKQILKGQSLLMKRLFVKINIRESLLIKIVRGNIKVLKNMSLKEILSVNEGNQWVIMTLKLIQIIMTITPHIDTENYLIYKTLALAKQLVYQTILYEIPSLHETINNQIFILGLKVQEIYVRSFVNTSKLLQNSKYYSLQDLKNKRDRHFHSLKTLSQIHLPQFNNLLQSVLVSLNSVQSAANYLLLVSYFLSPDSMNCSSYFYLSSDQDMTTFKKLIVGNGILLIQQLLVSGKQQNAQNVHFQDASLLFIERLLQLNLEHEIAITMAFFATDTPLPIKESSCQLITNKTKLLTSLFLHIFRIIHIKSQKQNHTQNETLSHYYFQTFIKYLTLLVNQNQLLDKFEIVTIQCQLKQYFMELKNYLRMKFKLEQRKYISEITVLVNHQPQVCEKSQNFKQKMLFIFQNQIEELLKLLQFAPQDWIGICYQIGGFLQLITQEKSYMKIITSIGSQFFSKIFMSCIDNINFSKVKLLTYFIASFMNFTEDEKIKNLNLWLEFVKPIFLSWIELFKFLTNQNFYEEGWSEICYTILRKFLQNQNLNFYMLKRSFIFKDLMQKFTSGLILFMNFNLQKKINDTSDSNLFKVMRLVFRNFSDYYLEDKNNHNGKQFLVLVQNLIQFARYKLNLINKRKSQNLTQSIEALKALEVILEYFSETCIKYSYKVNLIKKIQLFVNQQKPILELLENELYKFTVNYEKYIKFSSQKYRKSEMELLMNTSKIICQLCDIQKSSKSKNGNQQNTMSSSEQDNIELNELKSQEKHEQMLMDSMNSLEKQFVWFDIEGKKQIFDY